MSTSRPHAGVRRLPRSEHLGTLGRHPPHTRVRTRGAVLALAPARGSRASSPGPGPQPRRARRGTAATRRVPRDRSAGDRLQRRADAAGGAAVGGRRTRSSGATRCDGCRAPRRRLRRRAAIRPERVDERDVGDERRRPDDAVLAEAFRASGPTRSSSSCSSIRCQSDSRRCRITTSCHSSSSDSRSSGNTRGDRDRVGQAVTPGDVGRDREHERRVATAREGHAARRTQQRVEDDTLEDRPWIGHVARGWRELTVEPDEVARGDLEGRHQVQVVHRTGTLRARFGDRRTSKSALSPPAHAQGWTACSFGNPG